MFFKLLIYNIELVDKLLKLLNFLVYEVFKLLIDNIQLFDKIAKPDTFNDETNVESFTNWDFPLIFKHLMFQTVVLVDNAVNPETFNDEINGVSFDNVDKPDTLKNDNNVEFPDTVKLQILMSNQLLTEQFPQIFF